MALILKIYYKINNIIKIEKKKKKSLLSTRKSDLREKYEIFTPIFGGKRRPFESGVE